MSLAERHRLISIVLTCIVLPSCARTAPEADLRGLVANLGGEVRMLQQDEIKMACQGEFASHLVADFDGEGHDDHAALIVSSSSGAPIQWKGKALTEVELSLVVFRYTAAGYEAETLERIQTFLPAEIGLRVVPQGSAVGGDSEPPVALPHPAISRFYCEKSEVVYYWGEGRFQAVTTAD